MSRKSYILTGCAVLWPFIVDRARGRGEGRGGLGDSTLVLVRLFLGPSRDVLDWGELLGDVLDCPLPDDGSGRDLGALVEDGEDISNLFFSDPEGVDSGALTDDDGPLLGELGDILDPDIGEGTFVEALGDFGDILDRSRLGTGASFPFSMVFFFFFFLFIILFCFFLLFLLIIDFLEDIDRDFFFFFLSVG